MGETVNIKDFQREQKIREMKSKVQKVGKDICDKAYEGVHWIAEHPLEVGVVTSGIGIATKVVRKISDANDIYTKEHRRYDHSSRHYVKTKKMSAKDWQRFDEIKKSTNLTDTEVLDLMNKLK